MIFTARPSISSRTSTARQTSVRWTEFQKSIAHEATLFESVSARLAAAANTTTDSFVEPSDDALIRACRAVGHYMGIEVRAPRHAGDESSTPRGIRWATWPAPVVFRCGPSPWLMVGGAVVAATPCSAASRVPRHEPVALVPARTRFGRFRAAYELHDPQGHVRPVDLAVARLVAPTACVFYRTLPDNLLKKSDLVGFSLKLPALVHELAMVLVTALLGAVLGLALPVASGIIVDEILPAADLPRLVVICLFLVVVIAATAILQSIQGLLVLRIEGRVSATLIPAFWDRLLRLSNQFFARYSAGELASRAMELSELFKRASGAAVATIVTGFFSFFNLGLLYYYSWRLALGTTILLAVLFFITLLLLGGLLHYETAIRAIDGAISGVLLELLNGISTLRTAGAESRAFSRWARLH